jgi:hypothetical protein
VTWSGQESSPNSNTISTFTNTAAVQAINFDGLVTFTDISGDKVVTTDDITSIQGGLLKTAIIQSNATYTENNQQVPRLEINFDEGSISAQNFNINSSGNASFAGTITATAGDIGNWNIQTDKLFKNTSEFNANLSPENYYIFNKILSPSNARNKISIENLFGQMYLGSEGTHALNIESFPSSGLT